MDPYILRNLGAAVVCHREKQGSITGRRQSVAIVLLVSGLVLGCWLFLLFRYTDVKAHDGGRRSLLLERTIVAGWAFTEIPVANSAKRVLAADDDFT